MTEEEKQAEEAKVAAAAEVQAKIDEATAEMKKQLEEKEAALKELTDKDLNFGNLRKKTEEEVKKAEEAKAAKENEVETLSAKVKEMEEQNTKAAEERKERLVKAYAGKDEELKKTILFQFEKVKGEAKSEAEIEAAMKDAYILATGGKADEDVIKNVQGAGSSGSRTPVKPSASEVAPEVKIAADEFNKYGAGITPEDLTNPKFQVKSNQSAESSYNL
jgi:hypothetical protein